MRKKKGTIVRGVYKCPCCDDVVEKEVFVHFSDPCICKSGKKFKDCCYKEMLRDSKN